MVKSKAVELIKKAEGFAHNWYKCPAGVDTIGYGFTKSLTDLYFKKTPDFITKEKADEILESYVTNLISKLESTRYYSSCDTPARKAVVVDMVFNLGFAGFEKFTKCIKALQDRNFDVVANEMEKSKWFKQVGNRGKRNVKLMRDGE